MEPYNFWQDFFDTYQSLSDWMKMLWLIVPPAFILGLVALVMRPGARPGKVDTVFRFGRAKKQEAEIDMKQADHGFVGKLIYSIHRDAEDQFHIVAHGREIGGQPTLLLLDPPNRDPHAPQIFD